MQEAKASASIRGGPRTPRPPKAHRKTVVIGWNPRLFAVCQEKIARTGRPATTRSVVQYLCEAYLPKLVQGLHDLGFTGEEIGKRRPRQVNSADWDALLHASEVTGLPASELLRACMHQLFKTP
jgi:hypothetical protein